MSARLQVLVLTTTFPRFAGDDQPRFIIDLCKSLPDHIEPRVLAPSAPGLAATEEIEGVRVRRFRYCFARLETLAYGSGIPANLKARPLRWLLVPLLMAGMFVAVHRQIRADPPDVLHAHWWLPAGLAAVVAAAHLRSRILVTCHGADYYVLGPRLPRLCRWVFDRAGLVAMVSPAMIEDACDHGVDKQSLRLAPMGVDLDGAFRPDPKVERRGVLYVGRLVEKKGVADLLSAWAAASPDVRAQGLTIIGTGGQKQELEQLAQALHLASSVTFSGTVSHDELAAHYRRAGLLVFPSVVAGDNDQEGLGLVPIEAMGCECPVLVSDIPSLADVIEDGENGFVYPAGNSAALARRLDELLAAPERLQTVAARGRERVRQRFDWTAVGQRHAALFAELVASTRQH